MIKRDVAIIIPYVGLAHYILGLLKTITTKYSYHIYLIDNHSDWQTKEALCELSGRDNITILFNDTNIGVASAWNQGIIAGIEEFSVDYAVILNNDILLHPLCIDSMIDALKANNFALVSAVDVCGDCSTPDEILKLKVPTRNFFVDAPNFSCYAISIATLSKLGRLEKDIEEFPGMFDAKFYPAYFEDNDYHYRLKLVGMRGVKNNQALFYHFGSRTIKENEEIAEAINYSFLQNKERYIEKWGGEPGKEKSKIPFNRE
jgi:GT2 family glycosyltransferase